MVIAYREGNTIVVKNIHLSKSGDRYYFNLNKVFRKGLIDDNHEYELYVVVEDKDYSLGKTRIKTWKSLFGEIKVIQLSSEVGKEIIKLNNDRKIFNIKLVEITLIEGNVEGETLQLSQEEIALRELNGGDK